MDGLDISHLGDERIFVDPLLYAELDTWHAAASRLRKNDPIPWVRVEGLPHFRAITRHADLAEIERAADKFHNTLYAVLRPTAETEERMAKGLVIKSLVQMDGAEHRAHRAITNDWFKPAKLRRNIEVGLAPLARRFVDRMMESGERVDFAREIALHYPLHVIMQILGVPEQDYDVMLQLTQKMFGSEDPELAQGASVDETFMAAIMETFEYFGAMTAARRANPTEDVASTIANARINGEPLGDIELSGYYAIIATAGHDTTSSSLSGGLEALIRHPDQLQALVDDPSLIPGAVEEIIRWVTPVRHFMRQAQADYDLNGELIHEGEWVLLSYLSANHDDEVFASPGEFDIRRENASAHLAFGTGVHFCLGAHLARMELRAFLEELLPRIESIELDGEPSYMQTTFVGGPKHLPLRYRLKPAA